MKRLFCCGLAFATLTVSISIYSAVGQATVPGSNGAIINACDSAYRLSLCIDDPKTGSHSVFYRSKGTSIYLDADRPAWSSDGKHVAFSLGYLHNGTTFSEIFVKDVGSGDKPRRITDSGAGWSWHPTWSPNGKMIAYEKYEPVNNEYYEPDVYILNLDGGGERQLTNAARTTYHPDWSPDGSMIVVAGGFSTPGINLICADGTGNPVPISQDQAPINLDPTWSPDGTKIAFFASYDDYLLSSLNYSTIGNDNAPVKIIGSSKNRINGLSPSWSPNGKRIAYSSSNGSESIWTTNVDGTHRPRQITSFPEASRPDWLSVNSRIPPEGHCPLHPPIASATANPANADIGQTITFDGSSSSDPDPGDTLNYKWEFDDGTKSPNTESPKFDHAFNTPGPHQAKLTVTDSMGLTSQATVGFSVDKPKHAPIAVATANPTNADIGQTITFDGSSSSDPDPGDNLSFRWQLDDGTASMTSKFDHAFKTAGKHTATLTVIDPTGLEGKASIEVTINAQKRPPIAVASANPTNTDIGQTITFDGSGSSDPDPGDNLSYRWQLDDGTISMRSKFDHAFTTAGKHTATLTVIDSTGLASAAMVEVTVRIPPVPSSPHPILSPLQPISTPVSSCVVPKVIGLRVAKAKKLLKRRCSVKKVVIHYRRTHRKSRKRDWHRSLVVVRQRPKAGSRVALKSKVVLIVKRTKLP